MKAFLAFAVIAFVAMASASCWFYATQYQPLAQANAVLSAKNDLLTSDLAESKSHAESLEALVRGLSNDKSADELKISDLISQLNQSKSTPANPAAAVTNTPKEFVPPNPIPAQPNWTWTVSGKDYHNVIITKVEADKVSITYEGGLGTLTISNLTPDLQNILNYDPQLAAAARHEREIERAKADADFQQSMITYSSKSAAERAAALRVEQQKLSQLKFAMDRAQNAIMRATTHTNAYGVAVYTNSSHDRDGGAERYASVEVLQTQYDSAKEAYDGELKIISDLQN